MNWSDVGSAILKYAPLAGQALSSPIGAVASVGTLIANALGANTNPNDVMDYIRNNPEKSVERIQYEMANNIELQKIALEILKENNRTKEAVLVSENELLKSINEDSANARANTPNIASNPVYNSIMVLLVIGAFAVVWYCLRMIHDGDINTAEASLVSMIIGSFSTCLIGAFGFFFGSSLGAQLKDHVMKQRLIS